MNKLLPTILLVLLCLINGYSQGQSNQISNKKKDYGIVLRTIQIIEDAKGDVSVRYLLDKTNKAFGLGLTITDGKANTLLITSLKHKKIKIKNRITNIHDANKVSRYLKPLLREKLDSLKLDYDFEEFLSDFFITNSNENSWLLNMPMVQIIRKTGLQNPIVSKDSLGNFCVNVFNEQFGLKRGDKILSIQNIPCKFIGGGMADRLLSSILDTEVQMTVEQNGQILDKVFPKRLAEIGPKQEDSLALIGRTLYIKPYFYSKNFSDTLQSYIKSGDSIQSIIVDLQNCVGGLVNKICDFTTLFLKAGDTICVAKFINPLLHQKEFKATSPNPFNQKKIIVLINKRTASGAEIVASALKANKKAQIIGEKSLGGCHIDKTYSKIQNGNYACMTKVGEYCGAGNLLISGYGIEPDIKLTFPEKALERALIELNEEK